MVCWGGAEGTVAQQGGIGGKLVGHIVRSEGISIELKATSGRVFYHSKSLSISSDGTLKTTLCCRRGSRVIHSGMRSSAFVAPAFRLNSNSS